MMITPIVNRLNFPQPRQTGFRSKAFQQAEFTEAVIVK
jgi:predicted DNA-binding transcriptional regulator AlpA